MMQFVLNSRPVRCYILSLVLVILSASGMPTYAQSRVPPRIQPGGAAVLKTGSAIAKSDADFPGAPLARQLQMSACYVKETSDRAWQIRMVGTLSRGPGIYIVLYNEAGDVVLRTDVPFGEFTPQKPHIIQIPSDGKAQQYVIKLVGQQDNLNGIVLPLTNLPFEVYGDDGYSFGHGTASGQRRLAAFQVTSEKPVHFEGYGDYRILDGSGAVILESKEKALAMGDPNKKGGVRQVETIISLQPGRTYWIEPYALMYMGVRDAPLYLTFDPPRWFEPKLGWTLQNRPWWK